MPALRFSKGHSPALAARITLRPIADDDTALIEPWYGEAATAALRLDAPADIETLHRQIAEAAASNGELLVIVRPDSSDDVIGFVDYRLDEPATGWLTIRSIALASGQRGWGYGAEAVRLIEGRTNAEHFLAGVDPRNGLGLYFWLRQGYRPARPGEIFWRAPDEGGIISMIRVPGE
jgi:RimJ/RimL family protein N-acetyltransferase